MSTSLLILCSMWRHEDKLLSRSDLLHVLRQHQVVELFHMNKVRVGMFDKHDICWTEQVVLMFQPGQ